MAINKEIWVSSLVEGFFPNNSFATRSVDHSPYVSGHTVHVPQAGQAPTVTKNRNSFPAAATSRTDSDLTYDINKYDTAPVQVQALDLVELSYDKRTSIISQSKAALQQAVMKDLIERGLTADRLEAEGRGETQPIDTNETEEGRQNNRRVEFTITSTGGEDIQQIK